MRTDITPRISISNGSRETVDGHRLTRGPGFRRTALAGLAVLASSSVAGALFLASPAPAGAATHRAAATTYTFRTLNNNADPTFNQLLGINSSNVIAGYSGSGAKGHPNKGYVLNPPYGQPNYVNENFPGSAQTQVTGINNHGDTSGFWVTKNGTNHGFVEWNGVFASYDYPATPSKKGSVNQLLGINSEGVAVGFFNGSQGDSHAYQVNQATNVYTRIRIPGAKSSVATGINNAGDVVGFSTDPAGVTTSWLLAGGQLFQYQFPGGSDTQAFGISGRNQIVGSYTDASGTMHGFVLTNPRSHSVWQTIDDPNGVGSTVVNGINTAGDLVGFYTDAAGNTDGMLATPAS
jgi:hypothetical protein